MSKSVEVITDAEWEIMRVIWTQAETTSREIIDVLTDKMEWKPSTIKTLITRLVNKKYVESKKDGKHFIYSPLVREEEMIEFETKQLFKKTCNTKVGEVLSLIVEEQELSQADIEQLSAILAEKKKKAPKTLECHCLKGQCRCHKEEAQ